MDARSRVLLVEDDVDMRRLVACMLRKDGYDVTEVEDGVGLLRHLQSATWPTPRAPFDAIVSDIQMPDLTAVEVMDALPGRRCDVPIILMTAYGDADAQREALALGAAAVLQKPLDWQQLRTTLQAVVSPGRGAGG